ncbi:putative ATPase (AAA superfamily) [Treponema sp. JC4]|uniref:ATP-binding protein n=1 Tax=Treponema sp. JC4 TaxID=1124982 RepID=UPI00025B0BA7|nr:ATP-binding protein [Treponema sp. JC4]EID86229.1 putative ATPase (AAA superfamily) [Treponema sp. JC4]
MKRKIDAFLEEFYKEENNKALLITGARQIGKSYSIRKYGKTNYKNFIEINFIENQEAATIFINSNSAEEILLRLSAFTNVQLEKDKTFIFFDEVQRVPEIITAIKFLVEEGSYKYALSGSLLGIELKSIRSVPVGYMSIKEMYPMDIQEFFEACGLPERIFERLKNSFEQNQPIDEVIHKKLMELIRLYMVVGGMPAVVKEYLETNNIQKVLFVQKSILQMYKEDISQYDPEDKLYIKNIFDLIPSELNAQNKRFILKKLNENMKFNRYENSFIWLKEAGVALPVYNVDAPKLPLELSKSRNLFKLFSNDVGLLASQYAEGIQLKILNDENNLNFGAIYENAVAQELHSHGFNLYYYNSKKHGELDFVIKQDDKVIPLEIKSGKDYERHNALSNILRNEDYQIERAYVLCNSNIRTKEKITYLPIYMLMFIKNTELSSYIYKLDLSGI